MIFFKVFFVDSIISLDFDVTFSVTQFEEENVDQFIKNKNIKCHYLNIPKNNLPEGKKYSNHLMLNNALDQFIENEYEFLICSSADVIVPNNFFEELCKIKKKRILFFNFPKYSYY